jgi:hypothetical protein
LHYSSPIFPYSLAKNRSEKMTATNPFKVQDLVHKYGWDILSRVASLGIQNLAEAQILFVDSGHVDALDADDTEHGHAITKPLATLDYAIGLCTANEQSIILIAPGHVEDYDATTTGFDADVAGVKIIGIGHGSLRPRFDFNHATSKCVVGANNVQIENIVLRPSVATVAIGLDVETGITGAKIKDVEFAMGEAGDGTDEFVKALHLTSGNHDTSIENVKILAHASCDGATHGIHIDAASNRLSFKNVAIDGPYSTGGIVEDAAGLNHSFEYCFIDVSGTDYSMNSSSTYLRRIGNYSGLTLQWAPTNTGIDNIANSYYVNANVAASGNGLSWDSPFKTITEAIAAATTRNDTIYVAPGDYDEGATIAITTQGLRMIGPGPEVQNKAMIYGNAGAYDLMTINAHEVVIDGMAFSDATDTYDGIVIGGASASYKVTIRNCRLDGWDGEYGIQAGASNDCPDLLIENNLLRSWNTAAIQVNCTRSTIRNNIFHVVTDKIGLEHVPSGGNRPDNVYIDNLFSGVSNSTTTGIKFTAEPSDGTIIVARNMFTGTWDVSITQIAAWAGVENYASSAAGGALIDTVTD